MDTIHGSVRCPLLIGRDDLLELADRRLDQVAAGHGEFLLVAGEAGIGKSRYLDAVDQKARERGFVSAWGFVAPQDSDVPAGLILDMARTMLRDPGFADLGRHLLDLRDATIDAAHVRRRQVVMDIVDRVLATLTRPVLLGFDDLQWADDLSLEILAEIARRTRERPLLLCGGYRTDEAPFGTSLRDWRSRLLTQRVAEEVRLRPLSESETALVTTLILDTGLPAPRDVAAAVYERTDGIPLHIEELLGALGADARANGYAIREARVPDTIEDAVIARLSHRSPDAQEVARAGAIIGRCFVPDVLAGVMDVPPESIEAPLQELIDHAILWPPGTRGLYDFRHQLLRDAIYRSVPLRDRRRLHARAGEFGAQLEGQNEVHSSLHYERAGLPRKAYEAALVGARDAARLSAHREAHELYRRAIANLPSDLPAAERGSVLEAASDEAGAVEDNALSEQLALQAVAAYREAGELDRAFGPMSTVFVMSRRMGRPVTGRIAEAQAALSDLAELPDSPFGRWIRGNLLVILAVAQMDARQLDEARATLAAVRELSATTGDLTLLFEADERNAMVDIMAGRVGSGIADVGAIAVAAEQAGFEDAGVGAYRDAAMIAMFSMDYAASTRWSTQGLRYADAIEQSYCAHLMTSTSAIVSWAGGDWAAATTVASQAIADRGCDRGAAMARWALGYVALGRGQLDEAERELTSALGFGLASEAIDTILPPLWGLAELDLLRGDPHAAVERCSDALARAAAVDEWLTFVPFVVTGARAYITAGNPAGAAGYLEACVGRVGGISEAADAALAHARGLVALSDGATGVARSAFETAVAGWDAKGRAWEASWARLDLAGCLLRTGRYADALGLAVDVRATASRLDCRVLADRADTIQRMARGHVSAEEPWRPLTAREYAVAQLIREGRTNAEIADELGIAPKTASSHVEHILAKLGVSRRAEVAAWATTVERSALAR